MGLSLTRGCSAYLRRDVRTPVNLDTRGIAAFICSRFSSVLMNLLGQKVHGIPVLSRCPDAISFIRFLCSCGRISCITSVCCSQTAPLLPERASSCVWISSTWTQKDTKWEERWYLSFCSFSSLLTVKSAASLLIRLSWQLHHVQIFQEIKFLRSMIQV